MSRNTRTYRRRSTESRAGRRTGLFRTATACTLGVFVIASVYQASFAQTAPSRIYPGKGGGGVFPGRGDESRGDDDDGLSTLEIAGIAIGGIAVAALLFGAFDDDDDDGNGEEGAPPPGGGSPAAGALPAGAAVKSAEQLPPLPDGVRVKAIRLAPNTSRLRAGGSYVCYLNAQAEDGKWYSVTQRSESSIHVKEPGAGLARIDGAKNIFCLPITAPASYDGKSATLVGTFTPSGQPPLTAQSQVTLEVPAK